MGDQAWRQYSGEDRGRPGALARAGAPHFSECVRLGVGAFGVRGIPPPRLAEPGAPIASPES